MAIEIKLYCPENKSEWDSFLKGAKNGTFLFRRDYMEYHHNRFVDSSLLFYKDENLCALLPANRDCDTLFSHQGLSYGGLVLSPFVSTVDVMDIFTLLKTWMKEQGIEKLYYKSIPHIYHQLPGEEDLYALFRNDAKLIGRNISSALDYRNRLTYSSQRKRGLSKARKTGLTVDESTDFSAFWEILSCNLKNKYNANPTHSLDEMIYLSALFPTNIKLHTVIQGKNIVGGCVMYITDVVAHIQYIAATDDGKNSGAIDALVNYLINEYSDKRFFDYGISTERNGAYLNEQLIRQKEGFGLRGIVYDTYLIEL